MSQGFQFYSRSWVRRHPRPRGLVEFYGGEAVGLTPHLSYGALLEAIYLGGYSVMAVPVPIGGDHERLACILLEERDLIRRWLGYDDDDRHVPHFRVGHSIGCQFIALLQLMTDPHNTITTCSRKHRGVREEPMVLLAPFIGDADSAGIPQWLVDARIITFTPSMKGIERQLEQDHGLFQHMALLSFRDDGFAGSLCCHRRDPKGRLRSVPWFVDRFAPRERIWLPHLELHGGHMAPLGIVIGDTVLRPSRAEFARPFPRKVDLATVYMLNLLAERRSAALAGVAQARLDPSAQAPSPIAAPKSL